MIQIAGNCNENCNCGDTCVGGLTCRCGQQTQTTFICPGGNCTIPNNNNSCGNCGSCHNNCNCCCDFTEADFLNSRRLTRLLAPTRGPHTVWTALDPVLDEGVFAITYDRIFEGSREYVIGDGEHPYSELMKYGGVTEAYTGNNISVMTDANGKVDPSVLPIATATTYGAVKASVAGGAGQAILGDANGKYNFGDDATLDPSCLNAGVIPSGVTIPYSQVTGMPDNVAYATNAGHATTADSATTAASATNAGHATTADSATTASSATTAATAGKLAEAQRITVQMTVDGNTVGGYADFDGDNGITINMLPAVTTGGGSSSGTDDGYGDAFSSVGGYAELDASKFYVRMSSNQSYQTIKYRNDKTIIEHSADYSVYASSVEGVDWNNSTSRKKIFVKTPNVGTTYAVKGYITITTGTDGGEYSESHTNDERIDITGIPANTYFELTASNNGNLNSSNSAQIPDDPYKLYLVRTA